MTICHECDAELNSESDLYSGEKINCGAKGKRKCRDEQIPQLGEAIRMNSAPFIPWNVL
jgi:hypothetical protein